MSTTASALLDIAPLNSKHYTAVLIDLGNLLFTSSLSVPQSQPVPPEILESILGSVHWMEYEKGDITEDEAYSLLAQKYSVSDINDVKNYFETARNTLQTNPKLLKIIRELKESGLSIYATSNIPAPDWNILSGKCTAEEWALFDRIFISAVVHQHKPNIGFYKHVVKQTGIDPTRTIFIDDRLEHVIAARSLGIHGIISDKEEEVIRQLKNLFGDPVLRGSKFLASRMKNPTSVYWNNVEFGDNFCEFLIVDSTGDKSLVEFGGHQGKCKFNYFKRPGELMGILFPDDLETTALGLTIVDPVDTATKHKVMDEMLEYRDSDGIIQVYYDHLRPRIDAISCVNVLCHFYENGRGHELHETFDWVVNVLKNRAYTEGTYYYIGGDLFLFFLSRLIKISSEVRQCLQPMFKERIQERFGIEANSLSLAARILAAIAVDIVPDGRDVKNLLSMQREDGSWGNSWFFKTPKSARPIRNDGVTTALSIQAIQQAEKLTQTSRNTTLKIEP